MYKKKYNDSRSGMALVVVLGLITLLIISSVTFAILMRVERAGAANARNTIMARQAVKSALNYAMASIDKNIGTNSYPVWWNTNNTAYPYSRTWKRVEREDLDARDLRRLNSDNKYFDGKKPRYVNFWNDTFGSIDANVTDSDYTAPAYIMNYSLEQYLPKGLRHRAYAKTYQGAPDNEVNDIGPEWVAMTSDEGGTDVIGRYAFLAFNTTGYLDISAMAGLQQGNSGNVKRWLGESVEELKVHPKFFNVATTAAAEQKMDKLKGYVFENVGDVVNSRATSKGADFADESAYRTISANLPGIIQDDTETKQAFNLSPKNDDGTFVKGEELVTYYRTHKEEIIAAFYDSGLTKSSETFPHDAGKKYSEQALWAYLGLIDYVDTDDLPEGEDEHEKYARPATESMALFNGFIGTVSFLRSEAYIDGELEKKNAMGQSVLDANGNPIKVKVRWYDDKSFVFAMSVNGKIAFVNRSAKIENDPYLYNDIIEGRIGFNCFFEDSNLDIHDNLFDSNSLKKHGIDLVINGEESGKYPYGIFIGNDPSASNPLTFGTSPFIQMGFTISNSIEVAEATLSNDMSVDEFEDKTVKLPNRIIMGAVGRTLNETRQEIKRSSPAEEGMYDGFDLETVYLTASRDLDDGVIKWVETDSGIRVFKNKALAQKAVNNGTHEDYDTDDACSVRRWESGTVLSAEFIDPAMAHDNTSQFILNFSRPYVAVASNHSDIIMQNGEPTYDDFDYESPLKQYNVEKSSKDADGRGSLKHFKDFESKFSKWESGLPGLYCDNYFNYPENEYIYLGYSKFQKEFLSGKEKSWDKLKINIDGIHNTGNTPDFKTLWSSLYSKCGVNEEDVAYIQSVGELGFLPIGIYSTISLFGYEDDIKHKPDYSDSDSSLFNMLPDDTPYHTVLDNFTTIDDVDFGRINPNTVDIYALSSLFNQAPRNVYEANPLSPDEELAAGGIYSRITEDEAMELAKGLLHLIKIKGRPMLSVSEIGSLFENNRFESIFIDDNEREAAIISMCNLLSVRGQTFTILLRGEAFSPLFGRTEVRDGLGTTLATRSAVAQVWRDTVPDENGKYPMVLQFFKILDE